MKRLVYSAMLVMVGLTHQANAQSLKPGLWEINSKMQSGSGEMGKAMADMHKDMAAMPPEQRKMMQDMMAKQGVGMGAGGPGAISVKLCMTKEMLDRNEVATQDGDCKSTYSPRVGNSMKVSVVCTKPPSTAQGEVNFVSSEAYSTKMTINATTDGKSEKISLDGNAKWLSAQCGAIKPLAASKK